MKATGRSGSDRGRADASPTVTDQGIGLGERLLAISASPSSVQFGNAGVGTFPSITVTITNNSGSNVTLSSPFTITGPDAARFSVSDPGSPTIPPGGNVGVSVTFTPDSVGTRNAVLNILTTASENLQVPLQGTGTVATNLSIKISEFRQRGPAGGNDELIELYNASSTSQNIGGYRISASGTSGSRSDRATIPAGTILASHRHYLLTNTGYTGTVVGDQTYSTGVTDTGGIALLDPNNAIVDMVGWVVGSGSPPPGTYYEGFWLPSLGSTSADNLNRCWERKPGGSSGNGIDTDNNQTDFSLITPCLPQNLSSPATPADSVSVSGTVKRPSGRGITHAKVRITCPSQATPIDVFTDRIGAYVSQRIFSPGETCTVSVSQRRFTFNPSSATVQLTTSGATTSVAFTSTQ